MKIPQETVWGRIKLESYFIVPTKNTFKQYCKIIINGIEMINRLNVDAAHPFIKNVDEHIDAFDEKFRASEWITVAIPEEGHNTDYMTSELYSHADKYKIRLEENKEWVRICKCV